MRGAHRDLLGSRRVAIACVLCVVFPAAFLCGMLLCFLPLALIAELTLPHPAQAYPLIRLALNLAGAAFAIPVCAFAWPLRPPHEPPPGIASPPPR